MLLIFSLYLLVLPGLTCVEAVGCTDEVQSSVLQTADNREHETEDCSNFCNCSCCVHIVHVNYQSTVIVIAKPLDKTKISSFYNNISLPSNYFGNIWQPPKIG